MGKDSERGKYTTPEGSRTWEYLSALIGAIGTFSTGTMIGWSSPSLNELKSPNSRIVLTTEDASTLTASLSIGQLLIVSFSVFLIDRIGKKNSVLLSTVPMMLSWGMILIARSAIVLIMARIIAGISVGLLFCSYPLYMAEILSSHIRGSLAAIGGVTAYLGVLFMFGVAPHLGLQVTAGSCLAFTVVFLISFWYIPESPYFLVKTGRIEEAEAALEKLRGKTDVAEELKLIKATIEEKGKSILKSDQDEKKITTTNQSAFKQLFTIRGNLKAFGIGMIISTLTHFCGFQSILFYCHEILEAIGSGLNVYVISLSFCLIQLVAAVFTALVIDKFGRRPLLFISGFTSAFFLMTIATYFYLMDYTNMDVRKYSLIPVGSIFLLVIALNLGVTGVTGTIQAEIFAPDVKVLAICILAVSGSMMSIFSAKFYLVVALSWGFGHSIPFYGYTAVTFLCTILLVRLLPETKGKTLLEIQKELNA